MTFIGRVQLCLNNFGRKMNKEVVWVPWEELQTQEGDRGYDLEQSVPSTVLFQSW